MTSKPRNLYIIRPVGFNVGNNVIFLGIQNLLRSLAPFPINIISVDATSKYGLRHLNGFTAKSVHEMNLHADGVIVGGGNLLENGELDIDVDALAALRPPMLTTGVSWGRVFSAQGELVPRTDSISSRNMEALRAKSTWFLARDEATREFAAGFGSGYLRVGGCPTLFLKGDGETLSNGKTVISVRNPQLMSVPAGVQAEVPRQVESLITTLTEAGEDVEILCHDHRDIPFSAMFSTSTYRFFEDPREFLRHLRAARSLVSYRLHASIPALLFGTPTVNLSYDERAESALSSLGMNSWDLNIVTSGDVNAGIYDRLSRVKESVELWKQGSALHEELRTTQWTAMSEFLSRVDDYSRGTSIS